MENNPLPRITLTKGQAYEIELVEPPGCNSLASNLGLRCVFEGASLPYLGPQGPHYNKTLITHFTLIACFSLIPVKASELEKHCRRRSRTMRGANEYR